MATWQHLRSSTANKRPTTSLADGRIAINTNTASPGLFFKDSAGTGIVKVGPVHVGTTAPNSVPASGGSSGNYLGEQWLDTSVSPAQMKVWNGSTWVGVVADELPVSKLQDGAARQLIQTDAAGTGVEWTSNVDVPGTLDVTSTATFDSIAQHPIGTPAAPTITFTGNTNTGIYSPGTNQIAISTNGTGRLFVDASGRVGVGNTSPLQPLHVKNAGSTACRLVLENSGSTAAGSTQIYSQNNDLVFDSNSSERARIDSSGYLRLSTSSPGIQFNGDTAAANALDDYEEGTWTPAYQTSNSDISITSTTVSHAVYTKIGNRVFCTCRFFSNVASVGTGTVRVTGLPLTSASSQADVSCVISFAARFSTAAPVTATVRSSATQLDLITVYTDATLGGGVTYMPAANLRAATANSNIISISFNYIV